MMWVSSPRENLPTSSSGRASPTTTSHSCSGHRSRCFWPARASPDRESYRAAMIPSAPFGRTGHGSRRTIFGGAALGDATDAEADRALELVLRYQLNHLDTAASYGDSELRIAPWLAREG